MVNEGIVFLSTEDEAHEQVVAGGRPMLAVVVELDVYLAGIGIAEDPDFEVDQEVALQDAVVKNQVDEAVLVVERDALLAGFEAEATAEFHKEGLGWAMMTDSKSFSLELAHSSKPRNSRT